MYLSVSIRDRYDCGTLVIMKRLTANGVTVRRDERTDGPVSFSSLRPPTHGRHGWSWVIGVLKRYEKDVVWVFYTFYGLS